MLSKKTLPQITRGDTKFIIHKGEKLEKPCRNLGFDEEDPHIATLMDEEELKEIHLSQALETNSKIPTPDVIKIDEQIYDKLYPPMKCLPKRRIYVLPVENDDIIHYDMDSADLSWNQHWKFSLEKFERIFEWLENECELQVPPLEALLSQPFVKNLQFIAIEAIYDYWLNKRLVGRQRLLYRVKKDSTQNCKRTKAQNIDPYVAFRQCQAKMHTRKNRAADHESYIRMLQGRQEITRWLRFTVKMQKRETKKIQSLTKKLSTFEHQYRTQNFIEPHLTYLWKFADFNIYGDFWDFEDSEDSEEEMSEEVAMEVEEEEEFEFRPLEGSSYHAPVNEDDSGFEWSDSSEEPEKKFCRTTDGFRRRRIGRGGRIMFDRRFSQLDNSSQDGDYQLIDCAPTVKLNRLFNDTRPCSLQPIMIAEVPENSILYELVVENDEKLS